MKFRLSIAILAACVVTITTGCVTQTKSGNLALTTPMLAAAPKDGFPWFYVEVPDGPHFDLTKKKHQENPEISVRADD